MKTIAELIPASEILGSKIPLEAKVASITASTDHLMPGALFFALKGSQSDGHQFVAQAVAQGVMGAVVESPESYASHRAVLVKSSRAALGWAASRWHDEPTCKFKLVGVTGTNGKTTVSFLLRDLWRAAGLRTGLVGTVEYQVGERILPAPLTTPDALTLQKLFSQMVDERVGAAAIEVSSIALDQHRVTGSIFDVAVFLNLTPDHLDYHGDMASYLAAKRRLFTEHAPRAAAINLDDPAGPSLRDACGSTRVFTFSTRRRAADLSVEESEITASGISARLHTPQGEMVLRSPLLGLHNLSNCLAALTAIHAQGLDLRAAVAALATCTGAPGRLERVGSQVDGPNVFVDYAHTEDALRNVLESLRRVRADGARGSRIKRRIGTDLRQPPHRRSRGNLGRDATRGAAQPCLPPRNGSAPRD